MQFKTYEPHYLEAHDREDSLIITAKRNVEVTDNSTQRVRRYRLKNTKKFESLIENWLDQYFGEFEHELLVRDVVPVLVHYPLVVGQIAEFVRTGEVPYAKD